MLGQLEICIAEPTVAVVVPIFRHSALLCEAIESVLSQESHFVVHLVLVNDGCPHRETDAVCTDYALAYPNRISYLKKPNGGLSSARNHGIQYALNKWPNMKAVYLLDADNRLRKHSIAKAYTALNNDPTCDWIYPNIDMFGLKWAGDFGGKYSLLAHCSMNICEAGSLVHRRVFEAKVFFDTEMKLGFEDWDFFLSAAEKGFRGKNIDDFGFRYRKRPESMLADSHRDQEEIRGSMARKHKALMSPKSLVELEQLEAPRYAIYFADINQYLLTVDPDISGCLVTPEEFSRMLWSSWTARARNHAPAFLITTTSRAFSALREAKVLHWVLWRLENALQEKHIATVTYREADKDRYEVYEQVGRGGHHLEALLLMISPKCLNEVLRDEHSLWIDSLVKAKCDPLVFNLKLSFPVPDGHTDSFNRSSSTYDFLSQLHALRNSEYRKSSEYSWDWRNPGIIERSRTHQIQRDVFGGAPAYPKIPQGKNNIGFLLPLVEFGGVEKVALNVARVLKNRGWKPHLIVLDYEQAAFSEEWREVFESISFMCDSSQRHWDGQVAYGGTDIPPWSRGGNHGRAAGLLYWLDAIVNCHGAAAHGLMGQLRRQGVKTVASLHLSDMTRWDRPVGHTYLSLAYEHAYDFITTCSLQLASWCHGMGIPFEKIIPIPNAPSYEMKDEEIRASLERKKNQSPNQPLKVLFLGRLDRQKGIHRLGDLIENFNAMRRNVEWRIVGKPIVKNNGFSIPSIVQEISEKPATVPEKLTTLYEWADILLLLSDFEGLPLTILEGLRLGVVTIATDVGAVSEVIHHGKNGYLVQVENAIEETEDLLIELETDRSKLRAMSANAVEHSKQYNWETSTLGIHRSLQSLLASPDAKS